MPKQTLFQKMDTDKNGIISPAEFNEAVRIGLIKLKPPPGSNQVKGPTKPDTATAETPQPPTEAAPILPLQVALPATPPRAQEVSPELSPQTVVLTSELLETLEVAPAPITPTLAPARALDFMECSPMASHIISERCLLRSAMSADLISDVSEAMTPSEHMSRPGSALSLHASHLARAFCFVQQAEAPSRRLDRPLSAAMSLDVFSEVSPISDIPDDCELFGQQGGADLNAHATQLAESFCTVRAWS